MKSGLPASTLAVVLRTLLVLFLGAVSLSLENVASAQPSFTAERILRDTLAISDLKCKTRGESERALIAQNRPMEARSMALAERMICECMPAKVLALLTDLPCTALTQNITEQQFMAAYSARYIDPCAGELMRANYGDGCAQAMATQVARSEDYCSCVSKALPQFSDRELANVGAESADFSPQAALAQKEARKPPEPPPTLKKFMAIDQICRSR